MNKLDIAKKTLEIATSFGASKIAHDIIKNNVRTDSTFQKVTVIVGSFALGSAVSRAAAQEMNRTIDEVVHVIKTSTENTN